MKKKLLVAVAAATAACSAQRQISNDSNADEMSGMADSEAAAQDMSGMSMRSGTIQIESRHAALAGVTFAIVRHAPLVRTIRAVSVVVPNERALGVVNARVDGWIEKLYVTETGIHIEADEALFALYAPELVTVQQEFLLAKRLAATTGDDLLLVAARRRLQLWDISDEEIDALERTGEVQRTLTIRSAFSGHVMAKYVIEGQMIHAGDRLFEIADLSTVWIEPAIFEQDIPYVRMGQHASLLLDAIPGRVLEGRVTFIHPALDPQTRTLRVRIEIANRDFAIKPNMYATAEIVGTAPQGAIVPLTAILPTGDRDLAFVFRGGGVEPVPVVVGARGDSTILVTDGLTVGDTVVASATFLFDSESSLAAAMAGIMLDMGMGLDMGGMPAMDMDMPKDSTQPDSMAPDMKMDGGR